MRSVTFSLPWPLTAAETREVLSLVFRTTLVSYLGLMLLENLQIGFVSNYLDINIWLWLAIGSGALSVLWPNIVPEAKEMKMFSSWHDIVWIGLIAIGTMVVVWYKMSTIGWLVNVLVPLSGIIIVGFSLLIYYDSDNHASGQ